jgi:DNA-binding ferritin-like protein
MSPDPSNPLIQVLLKYYASHYSLTSLAESMHRNTTGGRFYEFHLLFERLYNSLYEEIDRIGEHVRCHGPFLPRNIKELAAWAPEVNNLVYDPAAPPEDFVKVLMQAYEVCILQLYEWIRLGEEMNKQGSLNIAQDQAELLETHKNYLLNSFLA